QAGGVALVVDVRKMPGSRANPAYNIDALPGALAPFGIDYMRIGELGGLRKQSKSVPAAVNAFWKNRSFHNYADYALSEPFRAGLAQLLDVSAARPTAVMCAEAVWWRCHRRIIADYLLHAGRAVYHLMGSEDVQIAVPTEAAVPSHDGLHYPPLASDDGSAGSSSSP
ncbi:MAG: DUF488 domain-containing protein, partial [Acidobacteria bacterium]|nr:DUF488 domain-containing protein [Acidobacteriota bacterium]